MSGMPIQQTKLRLPLPLLMEELGLGEHAKKSARCPFHEDKHNSFSVWKKDGAWFWKCHAGCGAGDEIDFLEKHKGISRSDAIKLFLEMAGSEPSTLPLPMQTFWRKSNNGSRQPFDWQQCVSALKAKDLVRLGNERWYSRAFCSWLHEKELVGLHNGCIAFPVHNNGTVVGAHYRLEDGSWRYHPQGIKTEPLVIGDLANAKQVHPFESPLDMFALADRTDLYQTEGVAFIATRGASNAALVKGLIPQVASICAWPQNDAAGEKWLSDLCAKADTKVAKAVVPAPHKDMNEWTAAGASVSEIYAALLRNELVYKRPKPVEPAKPVLIEFKTPSQLKNFVPPPGLVLVGDCHIVRETVFVIGGAPGIGKSRAAVALAEAGATGKDWFGLTVHRQFKTMIIQSENGLFRLSKEFAEFDCERLEAFVRVSPPPQFGMCFSREDFRVQLAAAIREFEPDIIIFDPWNAAARDEKAREYLETFELIRAVLPAGDNAPALGIVAHTRKPRAEERATGRALLNLLAGSYVLGSVPRCVFVMQPASDDTEDRRIVWTCCKNNDGELGKRSAWERANGLFARVREFDWDTFDDPRDERVSITVDDLATIFENGEKQLTRPEAVKALRALTEAGRTACYDALKPNGRLASHLDETGGLLSWKA